MAMISNLFIRLAHLFLCLSAFYSFWRNINITKYQSTPLVNSSSMSRVADAILSVTNENLQQTIASNNISKIKMIGFNVNHLKHLLSLVVFVFLRSRKSIAPKTNKFKPDTTEITVNLKN